MRARADVVAAVALVACALAEALANGDVEGSRTVTLSAAAVVAALVAVRRVHPLAASCVAGGVLAGQALVGGTAHDESFVVIASLLLLAHGTASHQGRRGALAGGAALLGGVLVGVAVDGDGFDAALAALVLSAPWAAGRASHRLRVLADELARERDVRARDAVLAERSRIARDLHDVVAHAISVMVVQAGGARGVLQHPGGEARALAALEAVEATGREALTELRGLLGLLRQDGAEPTARPGLDRLAELLEGADVVVEGEPVRLGHGMDVAVYRVVQEALTNARRHAPGAPARVRLHWTADALRVVVENPVAPARSAEEHAEGHGLVGMRERVGMYGGTLDVGPVGDRWSVDAVLPLSRSLAGTR